MGQLAYDGVGSNQLQAVETQSAQSSRCLNCNTPLSGPFCANCGQRDVPPYPSVRELAVDAFWELSGWDGRFASTVKALFRTPGMLTLEFLEGRRARYLSPLRLYLMASLVYFLVAATAPKVTVVSSSRANDPAQLSRPGRVTREATDAFQNQKELTPEAKAAALKEADRAPAVIRPLLRRMIGDPTGFRRGMIEMIPRMLFALLPIFAALVALLYRGRKYPEHLYFAIHLHAFVFLALLVVGLSRYTRLPPLVAIAQLGVFFWIPIYSTLAFRRVYGGSLIRTLVKEATIGAIYAFVSFIALLVVVYVVAVSS